MAIRLKSKSILAPNEIKEIAIYQKILWFEKKNIDYINFFFNWLEYNFSLKNRI